MCLAPLAGGTTFLASEGPFPPSVSHGQKQPQPVALVEHLSAVRVGRSRIGKIALGTPAVGATEARCRNTHLQPCGKSPVFNMSVQEASLPATPLCLLSLPPCEQPCLASASLQPRYCSFSLIVGPRNLFPPSPPGGHSADALIVVFVLDTSGWDSAPFLSVSGRGSSRFLPFFSCLFKRLAFFCHSASKT